MAPSDLDDLLCPDFSPCNIASCRLRLTNGGYKDLLEAIKKLKGGQTTKDETVQVARKIFSDGGCEDMFGEPSVVQAGMPCQFPSMSAPSLCLACCMVYVLSRPSRTG